MKLTNEEIFNAKEPLLELAKQKFPVKVAYGLAKLTNKLKDQYQIIAEVQNGLVKTYGELDATTGQVMVKPDSENFQKFVSEIEELMNEETEIVLEKICLPEKVDGRTIEIEPAILMALVNFVEVK